MPPGCPATGSSRLSCGDIAILATYLGLLACLPLFVRHAQRAQRGHGGEDEPLLGGAGAEGGGEGGSVARPGAKRVPRGIEDVLESEGLVEYPAAEQLLRGWFYRLGSVAVRRPGPTLGVAALLVLLCVAGLSRFEVMTDPQELWVGPGSQAATEKRAYEVRQRGGEICMGPRAWLCRAPAHGLHTQGSLMVQRHASPAQASFGPFYRITQLILTTTPAANSTFVAPSGLPAIVTDAHIRLLFGMQAEVDALAAGPRNASLADVCLKPLGDACASESVLQYWQMSRKIYDEGEGSPGSSPLGAIACQPRAKASVERRPLLLLPLLLAGLPPTGVKASPEFCFGHWSTQCRSAFQAPIDPRLVLGGFPLDPGAFRNYTADATAFVITYPLDSHPDKRCALPLGWRRGLGCRCLPALAGG